MNEQDNLGKSPEPLTVLTSRTVKPGLEDRFEAELHEFIARSINEKGQLGVHVIRPVTGSREYGILRRFSDETSRDMFYGSPLFREWEEKVVSLTEGDPKRQVLTGLETWFTLPGHRTMVPPPRWKMAMVTLLGVYPVSLFVPWALGPVVGGLPALVQSLFIAAGIVAALTWAVMPFLARVFNPWLNPARRTGE